ncbi:hypothetical protein KVH27_18510 [Streptomyces olivaceus]|uniref:hypothetical protein n=1 Tax=Streptomyces olivaceus TaxID=47716 RepID=UPI001CCA1627|nr:hypothetical protein [Streptomyces olivaceus]MBZ6250364.1 hypothetical protein [Streptomyces olivaceus]
MTLNGIQMLALGLALGAQIAQTAHAIADRRANRHAAAAARTAVKRAAGDRYLGSLALYRIQQGYGARP